MNAEQKRKAFLVELKISAYRCPKPPTGCNSISSGIMDRYTWIKGTVVVVDVGILTFEETGFLINLCRELGFKPEW